MDERGIFKVIIGVVVFIVALFILPVGLITVAPTDVAVEVDKVAGKVKDEPLGVGYHIFNKWTTDLVTYKVAARAYPSDTDANERSKEYTLDLKTTDGQNINVDLTIIYALASNDVPKLHAQIGRNYEDQIILPQIKSEARIEIGQYSAEEIYKGKVRETIQLELKNKLASAFAKYPAIIIQDVLMRHFSFSPDFEKAIEQKKMAAQQVEINKNMAAAQEEKSRQQEAAARGAKLQALQEAEGRAKSMEVEAAGRANAVKIEADASRYKLEQESIGQLAKYKAEAEGKRLSAEALGGGQNVVALEFAKNIPDKLQIWGIPTGANSTSLMDLNGVFGKMLPRSEGK